MPAPRLIVGNLDCEEDLAGRDDRRPGLPVTALRTVSALATLMRVFAREGDLLWTPLPVDPARMARVPGLPEPRLVSGPLADAPAAAEVVAWGETAPVAALRERMGLPPGPPVEAVVRANHRAFALRLARGLVHRLPGAGMIRSLWGLDKQLGPFPAGARWVLKAPLAASGRSRVFGEGRRPSPSLERKAGWLLHRHGEFLLEPWVERTADYETTGFVDEAGADDFLGHPRLTDEWGHPRGIGIPESLDDREADFAALAAARAGTRLAEIGYRGPFGVDSFTWRDAGGTKRWHLVARVNARLTFGHLAVALAGRVGDGFGVVLRTGKGDPPDGAIPLLHPGEDDPTTAWMEIARESG